MSMELSVFLRDRDVPTRADWQRAIEAAGCPLVLDEFDVRTHTGFLPARLAGAESGFEYWFDDAADVPAPAAKLVGDRDKAITFVLHGDMGELQSAMLAAAVLTRDFDGVYCDEDGETAVGNGVFELIARDEAAEQARRVARAEADSAITDRRCPHCGNPCPSYRKTCKACGQPVGPSQ